MRRHHRSLAAAISAALGVTGAEANVYTAMLKQIVNFSGSGSLAGNISSSTATWSYDDVSGLLTQTGGTFNWRFNLTPSTTFFRHSITGLVAGAGASASATTFTCTDGNFGPGVGASLCGNYNFGANFTNESTVTWGPGTATSRTLGGDDMALGPVQSVAVYDGMTTVNWVGTTLKISNGSCNPAAPGNANGCATVGGSNSGYAFVLEAVQAPVPAVAWLFGGALAALGAARRLRGNGNKSPMAGPPS